MGGDKFNCKRCSIGHFCDERGDLPGSRGPAPFELFAIDDVIRTRTCLLPMITPLSLTMLRFYGHYKDGYLCRAGCLADQPAAYVEAMQLIDATVKQLQAANTRK